jgi:hypothetical protein
MRQTKEKRETNWAAEKGESATGPEAELELMKRVDLRSYAAAQGFVVEQKSSGTSATTMKNPETGEKIIICISRDDGHFIYWNPKGSENDRGSIIDFIQNRSRMSLGRIRQELRSWLRLPISSDSSLPSKKKNRTRVQSEFGRMTLCEAHPYLESRGIPGHILSSSRFKGRLFRDWRGNIVAPHENLDEITGFEVRNRGFKGFSAEGSRSFWCSEFRESDSITVISESFIDSLSYAALMEHRTTRFISTAGTISKAQRVLFEKLFLKAKQNDKIVLAVDNDAGGDSIGSQVENIVRKTGTRLELIYRRPAIRDFDWNDVLMGRITHGK